MSDFDASLPELFDTDWRSARDSQNQAGLGSASYSAPDGDASFFVLKKVDLSGGTSVDTQEYPFFGGWSNNSLNEKPQTIKVEGYIAGDDCLRRRNALVEALRVATSDDSPGHVTLPSWGRFGVVVSDWDISEETNKQGQFPVSLSFLRVGLSESSRQAASTQSAKTLASALESQSSQAQAVFVDVLEDGVSTSAIQTGFTELSNALLRMVGRVQATKSLLNSMSAKVQSIVSLIDQGVRSPEELAAALYSAVAGIVDGISGTVDDIDTLLSDDDDDDVLSTADNAQNVALSFLATASFVPDISVATIKDQATKTAIQNLYRSAAFYGAAALIPSVSSSSLDRFLNLFGLFRTLEDSIDYDDPDLYSACTDLRIAVAAELDDLELYHVSAMKIAIPMPTLALAQNLGIDYGDFRSLNPSMEDEFLVVGEASYV